MRTALLWAALFAATTLAVHGRLPAPLDEVAMGAAAAHRSPEIAGAMNWLFRLGFAQLDAALALLWSAWLLWRGTREGTGLRAALPVAVAPLLMFLVLGAQAGLRLVVEQPAPPKGYELHRTFSAEPVGLALDRGDAAVREGFIAATSETGPSPAGGGRGSYPSGHAARVLFLALLAARRSRGRVGRGHAETRRRGGGGRALSAALVLSGLVGYSALYFGYHWPSDLLGGYLLALAAYPPAAWLLGGRQGR